jgi:hypothetical protein
MRNRDAWRLSYTQIANLVVIVGSPMSAWTTLPLFHLQTKRFFALSAALWKISRLERAVSHCSRGRGGHLPGSSSASPGTRMILDFETGGGGLGRFDRGLLI